MDVVFTRCAGLDVHKKSITACRMIPDPTGREAEGILELSTFGTMTRDLLVLADWLTEANITHVAMESTGEYWKPVYNLGFFAYPPIRYISALYTGVAHEAGDTLRYRYTLTLERP